MEKPLLKSKVQWIGWIGFLVLLAISVLILFSEYFYLSILTISPSIYLAMKAPYSWVFFKKCIITKTIFSTKTYCYEQIKQVDLLYSNASTGHVLTFQLEQNRSFSIDFQDKFWAEDVCNLLLKNNVQINNIDFGWLKLIDGSFKAENFYPRTQKEIERKKLVFKEFP